MCLRDLNQRISSRFNQPDQYPREFRRSGSTSMGIRDVNTENLGRAQCFSQSWLPRWHPNVTSLFDRTRRWAIRGKTRDGQSVFHTLIRFIATFLRRHPRHARLDSGRTSLRSGASGSAFKKQEKCSALQETYSGFPLFRFTGPGLVFGCGPHCIPTGDGVSGPRESG